MTKYLPFLSMGSFNSGVIISLSQKGEPSRSCPNLFLNFEGVSIGLDNLLDTTFKSEQQKLF